MPEAPATSVDHALSGRSRGQSSLGDLAVFLEISFELKDDVVEQTRGERVGNFSFQQAIARDPDFLLGESALCGHAASLRLTDAEVTVLFP